MKRLLLFLPLLLLAGCQTAADRTDIGNNAQLIYNLAGAVPTQQNLADIQMAAVKIGASNGTLVDPTQGVIVPLPSTAPVKASP